MSEAKQKALRAESARRMIEAEELMADWVAEMDWIYRNRHESIVRLMQAPSGAGERCKRVTSESELDIDANGLKQHSEAYLGGADHL